MQTHDLKIRVTDDVKNWLAARAEANDRSMNGELNQIMKAFMVADTKSAKRERKNSDA